MILESWAGLAGLLVVGLAIGWLLFVLRLSGVGDVSIPGPALVLTQFDFNPAKPEALLTLRGRRAGLVGWFLSAVGLDVGTTLSVAKDYVSVNRSRLAGQSHQVAPVQNIASMHCGYSLDLGLLVLALGVPLGGMVASIGLRSIWPVLMAMIVAAFFLLALFLSKRLLLAFETSGGSVLGVQFRRGIVETVAVDIEQLREVILVFSQLTQGIAPPASPPADPRSGDRWYYAKGGQKFGPVSGAELRQMALRGQLSPSDMVWKEGTSHWIPAQQVKGLSP